MDNSHNRMNYSDLMRAYHTSAGAARALGIKNRQTVHRWKTAGIPEEWQLRIQNFTGGALKAEPTIVAKYQALLALPKRK